jgi:hypothetical protein
MARPRKKIDETQVEELAALGCTASEIATVVHCSESTVKVRFHTSLVKGRERLKTNLRRQQYQSASQGSVAMQIWLGRQYLGQSNHVEFSLDEIDKRLEMELRRVAGDDDENNCELLN